MAQQQLKELLYDGKKVIVEVARRDGSGNTITTTYATKTELSTELNGKEPTITIGTGLQRSSSGNTISVKTASASVLGGIKIGTGLSIDTNGVVSVSSASAVAWSGVTDKPFASVSSDFSVTSNTLSIDSTKWATKQHVADAYVALTTYNTLVGTTLPATYQTKITSSNKIPYSNVSGTPTNVSDFTNDSGFITKAVNDLTNYYKKTETYTKTEIESLIAGINQFKFEVASELPEAKASTMYKIYLIPASNSSTNNAKEEYITIRSGTEGSYTYSWEHIGSTNVDLTNYVQADGTLTSNKILLGDGTKKAKASSISIDSSTLANVSTTVPTSSAVYTALSQKQNTLTQASNAGNGIKIDGGVIASVITATDVTLDY